MTSEFLSDTFTIDEKQGHPIGQLKMKVRVDNTQSKEDIEKIRVSFIKFVLMKGEEIQVQSEDY